MYVSQTGAALITPTPNVLSNATFNGGIAISPAGAMYVCGPSGSGMPYILAQSAVPVMIAQSSLVVPAGQIPPGAGSSTSVTLSGTSGSVTVTLGSAVLAGTSADNGKQITFWDSVSSVWRSILITAFSSTTSCTGTLSSTAGGVGPHNTSNNCFVGNPLPTNYTSGIWVYLPAGAVSGGAAGFYWCMAYANTTANGILQVTTTYLASMGVPAIPSGPFVNAVGSGSNFTQTTSQITLASVTVPGGAMGANGSLRSKTSLRGCPTAGSKGLVNQFGATTVNTATETTQGSYSLETRVWNQGVQNAQAYEGDFFYIYGSQMNVSGYSGIDASQTQAYTVLGNVAVATDFIVLAALTVEVLPG